MIASGKEVGKKYLENKYNAKSFRFSTILRDVLKRLDVPASRDNLIALSTWARETFGQNLLAKAIAKDVSEADDQIVVVDGIRRLPDIEYLAKVPGFILVSIEAGEKIRYERMVKRDENPGDADKTFDDFLADQRKETELTIPEVMAAATYKLDNDGSLEDLYRQIDKIIADAGLGNR